MLSLANIEALADSDDDKEKEKERGGEIDFSVPQKNNNPQTCILYLDTNGKVHLDKWAIGGDASYSTVRGIENICENVRKDMVMNHTIAIRDINI